MTQDTSACRPVTPVCAVATRWTFTTSGLASCHRRPRKVAGPKCRAATSGFGRALVHWLRGRTPVGAGAKFIELLRAHVAGLAKPERPRKRSGKMTGAVRLTTSAAWISSNKV